MSIELLSDTVAFEKVLIDPSIRNLEIDAFADGVMAHRNGVAFHENPYGGAEVKTVNRLSWTIGWNERALARP